MSSTFKGRAVSLTFKGRAVSLTFKGLAVSPTVTIFQRTEETQR
jgi:hypothetical protein